MWDVRHRLGEDPVLGVDKGPRPVLVAHFVLFQGVLSFCCSLQGQRYGSVLPGFVKKIAGRRRRCTSLKKVDRLEGSHLYQHNFVSSQNWFSIHDQMELFIECCYGSKAEGSDSSHFGPGYSRNACCIYRSAARCYRRTDTVCAGMDFARRHFAFLRLVPC